jgi:Probable cobalt transporter subunit (CbtB)
MSELTAPLSASAEPLYPPAIALEDLWPWALFALSLLALIYMVAIEQGATSLTSGNLIHEWVHDGRHLLGFPCH